MTPALTIDHLLAPAGAGVAASAGRHGAADGAARTASCGVVQAACAPWLAAVWQASALGTPLGRTVPSGWPELDRELPGGGWPCGAVVEVLGAQHACIEWQLVAGALRAVGADASSGTRVRTAPGRDTAPGRSADGDPLVVVGPPRRPHPPGLAQCGIDPRRLTWVRAQLPSERLWAAEQYVRADAASVLAWLPQARPEQLRRLQVCAQRSSGLLFVFRPLSARREPSAAPLRMAVELRADWTIAVEVFKRRGPAMTAPLLLPACPVNLAPVLAVRARQPSRLAAARRSRSAPMPSAVPMPPAVATCAPAAAASSPLAAPSPSTVPAVPADALGRAAAVAVA